MYIRWSFVLQLFGHQFIDVFIGVTVKELHSFENGFFIFGGFILFDKLILINEAMHFIFIIKIKAENNTKID